jgi:dynein heavy chain
VFIMGPAGAGKTQTYKMLIKANERNNRKIDYVDIDPKVVHSRDLYGYMMPSKEWKDGLLSKLLRSYADMESTNPKYIILDGDLDANWIESMNSVMDDNKILTLANNERIPVKSHMKLLFEIRDLKYATPATVSRAGILYISDDSGHQWKSYVKSWIEANYQNEKETGPSLQKLFDRYIEPTIIYLKKSIKFLIPVSYISMIISLCRILKPLITPDCKNIEYIFVFSWVWACGGGITEKDGVDFRKDFSTWWKSEWKGSVKFP